MLRGGSVLFALPLLDELSGGLSVVSAPALSQATGSGLVTLTTALLAAPMLGGMLEAPILAWTDRRKAKRHGVVAFGIAGMALSLVLVSFVHGPVGLALATAAYGPASGIALGTGEAMLVDGASESLAARRLARWTLFASLGDVLAPVIVALATAAAMPWRTSFRFAAIALLLSAFAVLAVPSPLAQAAEAEPTEPVRVALRAALTNRRLFGWLLAAALCTLLDEVLAVLAAVWTSAKFSPVLVAPVLIAFSLGSVAGAACLERGLARWSRNTALMFSSALCAAAFSAWLMAARWPFALACAFVCGMGAAPLHPLAKAEAFAVLPSRPGLVNGASQAFLLIDLVAPPLLAWVAERHGAGLAVALLGIQPLALFVVAVVMRVSRRRHGPAESARRS